MAKGPDAFRTISEAAAEVGVPAHVLRFWESRLPFIKPMKRGGGRRFYRPQDIATLRTVRVLLHERGLSLKAVQDLHRRGGGKALAATVVERGAAAPLSLGGPASASGVLSLPVRRRLRSVLDDLETVRARVDAALRQRA